ncbi:Fc.00g110450.m01.CDS01 [Cosmosporella sp. VM-42]
MASDPPNDPLLAGDGLVPPHQIEQVIMDVLLDINLQCNSIVAPWWDYEVLVGFQDKGKGNSICGSLDAIQTAIKEAVDSVDKHYYNPASAPKEPENESISGWADKQASIILEEMKQWMKENPRKANILKIVALVSLIPSVLIFVMYQIMFEVWETADRSTTVPWQSVDIGRKALDLGLQYFMVVLMVWSTVDFFAYFFRKPKIQRRESDSSISSQDDSKTDLDVGAWREGVHQILREGTGTKYQEGRRISTSTLDSILDTPPSTMSQDQDDWDF